MPEGRWAATNVRGGSDGDAEAAVRSAVARGREGDVEALRFLYARFHAAVRDQAMAVLKDPFEAEDVAHVVFLKVMTQLDRFDETRGPFRAWLLRVGRNAAIDTMRRRRDVPWGELPEPDRRAGGTGTVRVDQSILLRQAVRALPAAQAEIVMLRLVGGYTPAEIATLTGRSISSVNNLLHRGRLALRCAIREVDEHPQPAAA